ncbi:glutathione S-transferase 2-like isoform X2 [Rhipicephalus microplus]|uniref:glutathione S-transferase 2-like isoform X2 n=1 Tax=Rhipicephalus microplus TaxID=6941 RepID=UPI003F6B4ACB
MAPVLGYWNIRGLAQPIRLLLAHVDAEVEEKHYSCGPPPDFDKSYWLSEKPKLGLDFPNLPYYIDDDVKLTQSMAILRYLARKHDLMGKTEAEKQRVDVVEQQLADFRMNWGRLCYSPDFVSMTLPLRYLAEKLKGDYLKDLPASLKALSDYLGDHKFFAGDNLTYVDFIAYEMLDQHLLFAPDCLKDFANLNAFADRVAALPRIAAYLQSDKCIKWPLNGDMASFGSRLQKQP